MFSLVCVASDHERILPSQTVLIYTTEIMTCKIHANMRDNFSKQRFFIHSKFFHKISKNYETINIVRYPKFLNKYLTKLFYKNKNKSK